MIEKIINSINSILETSRPVIDLSFVFRPPVSNLTKYLRGTGELTRDDDMASFKSKYDKFGIMEVRISKAVDCGVSDKPAAAISQPVGSIPEKALKGRPLDVSTECGKTRPAALFGTDNV